VSAVEAADRKPFAKPGASSGEKQGQTLAVKVGHMDQTAAPTLSLNIKHGRDDELLITRHDFP
jgi:hypothetical protein